MSHIRTQIRQDVVAALRGNTSAGDKVFANRTSDINEKRMRRALIVYTAREQVDRVTHSTNNRKSRQQRNMELVVSCLLFKANDFDDEADRLAAQVEEVILSTSFPNVQDIALRLYQTEFTGEGNTNMGEAELRFVLIYFTEEGAPQTALE
jgi:hypothetical protein